MSKKYCLFILKPDMYDRDYEGYNASNVDEILSAISDANLIVLSKFVRRFDVADCQSLYEEHVEREFFPRLENYMCSGESLILLVSNADEDDDECVAEKCLELKKSLRIKFARNKTIDAVHSSDSDRVEREARLFFSDYIDENDLAVSRHRSYSSSL